MLTEQNNFESAKANYLHLLSGSSRDNIGISEQRTISGLESTLCASQERLGDLLSRNMQCVSQQAVIADIKRLNGTPERRSLSAKHREKKQQEILQQINGAASPQYSNGVDSNGFHEPPRNILPPPVPAPPPALLKPKSFSQSKSNSDSDQRSKFLEEIRARVKLIPPTVGTDLPPENGNAQTTYIDLFPPQPPAEPVARPNSSVKHLANTFDRVPTKLIVEQPPDLLKFSSRQSMMEDKNGPVAPIAPPTSSGPLSPKGDRASQYKVLDAVRKARERTQKTGGLSPDSSSSERSANFPSISSKTKQFENSTDPHTRDDFVIYRTRRGRIQASQDPSANKRSFSTIDLDRKPLKSILKSASTTDTPNSFGKYKERSVSFSESKDIMSYHVELDAAEAPQITIKASISSPLKIDTVNSVGATRKRVTLVSPKSAEVKPTLPSQPPPPIPSPSSLIHSPNFTPILSRDRSQSGSSMSTSSASSVSPPSKKENFMSETPQIGIRGFKSNFLNGATPISNSGPNSMNPSAKYSTHGNLVGSPRESPVSMSRPVEREPVKRSPVAMDTEQAEYKPLNGQSMLFGEAPNGHYVKPDILKDVNKPKPIVLSNGDDFMKIGEHRVYNDWDPAILIDELYKIDYSGCKLQKNLRFINMEGHLEHLPLGMRTTNIDHLWKEHYFKTKDGRLQWFETPYSETIPTGEVLLAEATIEQSTDDHTLLIYGGKDGAVISLRSPAALIEKWRNAIQSHSALAVEDTYVQPLQPSKAHEKIIVIEVGSCSMRAGFVTRIPCLPMVYFPCIASSRDKEIVAVGGKALKPSARNHGSLIYPISLTDFSTQNNYVVDLESMRKIFFKIFEDLGVSPQEYQILLSCPQNFSSQLIATLMRTLLIPDQKNQFEPVKSVAIAKHPTLVLYSYDVTTGVVVDIGDRLNIVPIVDGYVIQSAIISLPYGGSRITEELKIKLCEQNQGMYTFSSTVEQYILRYLMERSCYFATDYDEEVKKFSDDPNQIINEITLAEFEPSTSMQTKFKIDSAAFTSTEGLFKPKKWGLDFQGLHELIFKAVQNSPMDARRGLYKNIYLAGGATLLPGLAERIEFELSKKVASSIHINVHQSPWRNHAAFLGAQVFATTESFNSCAITKDKLDVFLRQLYASVF